jgi:hypothetical protein
MDDGEQVFLMYNFRMRAIDLVPAADFLCFAGGSIRYLLAVEAHITAFEHVVNVLLGQSWELNMAELEQLDAMMLRAYQRRIRDTAIHVRETSGKSMATAVFHLDLDLL